MFLVIGIDAATGTIIRGHFDKLPNFRRLCEIGKCREMVLQEKPISPSIWCGMFCGKTFKEHGHDSFVVNGNIVKREDIKLDFIWDILHQEGKSVKAINVPFVVPPYSFGTEFKPVGFGLPTNEKEWREELERVTRKTMELLEENPDVLICCYTLLDRIQHFHWGEPCVLEWYTKVDTKIGELIFNTRFLDDTNNKLIVISDHGFCAFGEAKIQTLPRKSEAGKLKGDHHENALLITVNVAYPIERPQDVFFALKENPSSRH